MSLENITITVAVISNFGDTFIVKDNAGNSYSAVPSSSLRAGVGYTNVFDNTTDKFMITSSTDYSNNLEIPITRPAAYVYFSNDKGITTSGKGALFWFSTNDYYTPNTPTSVTAANCLNTTNMGVTPNPPFTASISFWRKDVSNTLDNGLGSVRAADGTKTIYINDATYPLSYDVTNGYWGRTDDIFTADQGLNIAAIRLDSIGTNSSVANNGVGNRYYYVLPSPSIFTRTTQGVLSGFSAGSTGISFFNLG